MKYRDIEGAFPKRKIMFFKNYAFDDYSDVTKKKPKLFLSKLENQAKIDFQKLLTERIAKQQNNDSRNFSVLNLRK